MAGALLAAFFHFKGVPRIENGTGDAKHTKSLDCYWYACGGSFVVPLLSRIHKLLLCLFAFCYLIYDYLIFLELGVWRLLETIPCFELLVSSCSVPVRNCKSVLAPCRISSVWQLCPPLNKFMPHLHLHPTTLQAMVV